MYRAPTVGELYAGQSDSFPTDQDPCNTKGFGYLSAEGQALCLAQAVPAGGATQSDSQLRARVGGNPDLKPEEGDTVTVGISYSPEFLEGFNVTVDYWDIKLDNVIDSLSATNVLNLCYDDLNTNECQQITRNPDGTINAIFCCKPKLSFSYCIRYRLRV
ncbi:TonB-dependent receptor [Shewanella sp. 0m-11]